MKEQTEERRINYFYASWGRFIESPKKKRRKDEKKGKINSILKAIQLQNLFKSNIYFVANNNGKCHNFSSETGKILFLRATKSEKKEENKEGEKGFH